MRVCGMDCSGLGQGQLVGCCEQGNELPVFTNYKEFLGVALDLITFQEIP